MGSQPYNHHDPRMQHGPSQSSPYASHDGTGPYYSPPAYPYPAPMSRPPAGGGYMPPGAPNVLPGYVSGLWLRVRVLIDFDSTLHRDQCVAFAVEVIISHETDIHQFVQKQRVSARIMTDTWVMGVVIGVVHICSKVTTVRSLNGLNFC
jgi:hypothetical protein